jgi:hypothetical protein
VSSFLPSLSKNFDTAADLFSEKVAVSTSDKSVMRAGPQASIVDAGIFAVGDHSYK